VPHSESYFSSDITTDGLPSSPPLYQNTTCDDTPIPATDTPIPATGAVITSLFEKYNHGTFYRYKVAYDSEWAGWIAGMANFKIWVERLTRSQKDSVVKRGMNWGVTELRSSLYWEHYQEGASSRGVPGLRCIYCSVIIQHPYKNGSSGMKDHHNSQKCEHVRRKKGEDPTIMEALRRQGERVYHINRPIFVESY
jgi:hypothetical protein